MNKGSDCQIKDIHFLGHGSQDPEPLFKIIQKKIKKLLGPKTIKRIKTMISVLQDLSGREEYENRNGRDQPTQESSIFQSGDLVRVKTEKEIKSTLNHKGYLKGCGFMEEMYEYCGTTQHVLKPVERFVDERDLRIRKAKGLVLLDGVVCYGTENLGRCDRNCYYFWREEWLEKISTDGRHPH